MPTLLSKYLKALKVPHTTEYADKCFASMTFKNLFGLTRILEQFGVQSRGLKFTDLTAALSLPVPFLAQVHGDVVIVEKITGTADTRTIECQTVHGPATFSEPDFISLFTGIVLQSKPTAGAAEPDLDAHRFAQFADRAKTPALLLVLALLATYGSVQSGVWTSVWRALVFVFYTAGVGVCYLLWLKTNGVQSRVADSMCGLTTKHGCDKVLDTRLASFMGIFKWSEVGMGYFAVSLMALLMFPDQFGNLALLNACCLPYTIWSVTTQKFIIHAWCTLCLTVQTLLWLLFAAFALGGAWHTLHITMSTFVLLGGYIAGVLIMNLINSFINKAKSV